ncbi:MAG TPA: hypothetical protein PLD99_02495 [Parcubacteria group bacterium]|nr:hypothetical protein [Parcubacteria group bacterium]
MKKILIIGFFVILGIYVVFQGRFIIFGPEISIELPKHGSIVDTGPITVSGKVKNISYLSLNDGQIYTDNEGYFEEKLIAQDGTNIIKITAKDRFGRVREKLIEIQAR